MRKLGIACLLLLSVSGSRALAERQTQERSEASHVVVGTVEQVFRGGRGPNDEYIVAIRIEKLEKGNGYEEGDLFYAYCFQRKRNAPRVPAAYGHKAVPKAEQRIRAFIDRREGMMEGIYPEWFEVLKAQK